MNLFTQLMTRVLLLVSFILLISVEGKGQCPTLSLTRTTGTTCGTTPITISGNTFGGSATRVTLTDNGTGTSYSDLSARCPHFLLRIRLLPATLGRTVIITITTDNYFTFLSACSGYLYTLS